MVVEKVSVRPSVRRAAGHWTSTRHVLGHVTGSTRSSWPRRVVNFLSFVHSPDVAPLVDRSSTLLVFHVVGQYRSVSRLRRSSFVVEMIADNLLSLSRRRVSHAPPTIYHSSLIKYLRSSPTQQHAFSLSVSCRIPCARFVMHYVNKHF